MQPAILKKFCFYPTWEAPNFIVAIPVITFLFLFQVYSTLHHMLQKQYCDFLPYVFWRPFLKFVHSFASGQAPSGRAFFHLGHFMRHLCLNHCHCHQSFYARSCQSILAPLFPLQAETFQFKPLHLQTHLLLQALAHSRSSPQFCFHDLLLFPNSNLSSTSSCHFIHALRVLSYMSISCSPIRMSCRSFASYHWWIGKPFGGTTN